MGGRGYREGDTQWASLIPWSSAGGPGGQWGRVRRGAQEGGWCLGTLREARLGQRRGTPGSRWAPGGAEEEARPAPGMGVTAEGRVARWSR